jgi:hypothetical protein
MTSAQAPSVPFTAASLAETASGLVPARMRRLAHEHPLAFWGAVAVAGVATAPYAWRLLRFLPRERLAQVARLAAVVATQRLTRRHGDADSAGA